MIGEIGHTMGSLAPFHRLLCNSTELFRCELWKEVLNETKRIAELRESAGEERLRIEAGTMYLQALIEYHTLTYIASMFTRNGFMNGTVQLSDKATNAPGQVLKNIGNLESFDSEDSETVLFGVLHAILTYVEYLLEIGAVQFTEIDGGTSTEEHIASLKSNIETRVPYVTQPKQWPYYTPRRGIDYW